MAVVEVNERFRDRRARCGKDFVREYTRVFQVITDSKLDTEYTALTAAAIPDMYSQHPGDTSAVVVDLDVVPDGDGWNVWKVNVTYSSNYAEYADNPLLKPTLYDFSFARYTEARQQDAKDVVFVNSAGAPYGSIEIDMPLLQIRVSKNFPAFNVQLASDFQNTINSSVWKGFAAKTVKCCSITGNGPQFQNGVSYFAVELFFEHKQAGWRLELLDEGFEYRSGGSLSANGQNQVRTGGTLEYFKDDLTKQRLQTKQLLAGDGTPASPSGAFYNKFDIYREKDFSILGL